MNYAKMTANMKSSSRLCECQSSMASQKLIIHSIINYYVLFLPLKVVRMKKLGEAPQLADCNILLPRKHELSPVQSLQTHPK